MEFFSYLDIGPLEFIWDLEFGDWCFPAKLELGCIQHHQEFSLLIAEIAELVRNA